MDCGVGGRGCNLDYDKNDMASRFTLSLRVQHRREKMAVVCLEEKFEVRRYLFLQLPLLCQDIIFASLLFL